MILLHGLQVLQLLHHFGQDYYSGGRDKGPDPPMTGRVHPLPMPGGLIPWIQIEAACG